MIIVSEKLESERLERQISLRKWALHDIVLDDGTWLPDTMVFEDRAFGLLIGGHTAFQFFRDVPQVTGRNITHDLRLRRRHWSLFFGWWLRKKWARKAGARLEHPTWRFRL